MFIWGCVILCYHWIYHSTVHTEYTATIIDNIENDINVALVVAHKRHICRSGLKRVKYP